MEGICPPFAVKQEGAILKGIFFRESHMSLPITAPLWPLCQDRCRPLGELILIG